jgi:hypothetical protein
VGVFVLAAKEVNTERLTDKCLNGECTFTLTSTWRLFNLGSTEPRNERQFYLFYDIFKVDGSDHEMAFSGIDLVVYLIEQTAKKEGNNQLLQ